MIYHTLSHLPKNMYTRQLKFKLEKNVIYQLLSSDTRYLFITDLLILHLCGLMTHINHSIRIICATESIIDTVCNL